MLENVLTDSASRATAIDIFDGEYERRYRANVEATGAGAKVTTIKGPSQIEARRLLLESFDVVYIDGSHNQADVLEDAVLCWRLLKPGGLLIFDDYRWAGCFNLGNASDAPTDMPKLAIDAFCRCFAADLDVVQNSYQLIVRKRAG
jgi:predicted O-methyltransferase YrrM